MFQEESEIEMKSRLDETLLRAAVVLCGAALLVGTAMAQDAPPPPLPQAGQNQQGPPGERGGRRGGPEERLKMLEKQLSLTPDQTTQVKAIFADERTKMEALRSDTATSEQDKRPKMMAIHQDEETRLAAVFTPDQKAKYQEMEAKMRERMKEHRPGGPGGDAPPPPPPPPQQ